MHPHSNLLMLLALLNCPQFELLDALYVVLRQMPRFRRAAYTYVPAAGAGGEAGVQGAAGGGPTGREFDNMAEFLAYRWVLSCPARWWCDQAREFEHGVRMREAQGAGQQKETQRCSWMCSGLAGPRAHQCMPPAQRAILVCCAGHAWKLG
eukprot:1159058-Pelagomonas_calceolata.AAC.6